MVGIPVQISVSMCRVSLHCGVDSMVGVRGAFSVQKGTLPSLSGYSIVNLMWASI